MKGDIVNQKPPKTLLQIFCKIILIVKSIEDPDDKFKNKS